MNIINISKGQYLSEIINEFVTNTIYFKTLPNIGATRLELMSKRNSIVIEPNVPVIKGKKAKGILSIYEKVGIDEIVNYLLSNHQYKKILVTPESFYKLLMAAKMLVRRR